MEEDMYKRRRIKRINIAILLVLCFAFFLSQPALAEDNYQPYSETSSESGGFSEEELELLKSFAAHFMSREELERYMRRVLLDDSQDLPEDVFDLNFDGTFNTDDVKLMHIYLELLRCKLDLGMDGDINAKDFENRDLDGDGVITERDDYCLRVLLRLDFNCDGKIDKDDIYFLDLNKDGRADYEDLYLMRRELEGRETWSGDFLAPFTDNDGRIQRQVSIYGVEWLYDYTFDKDGNVTSITVSTTLDDRKYEIIIEKYSITIRRYHVFVGRGEPDPPPDDSGPMTDGIYTCSVNSSSRSPQDERDRTSRYVGEKLSNSEKDLILEEIKFELKDPIDLEEISRKGIGSIDLPALWRAFEKLRKERERITQNFQEATEHYFRYAKRELKSLNYKYPELFKDSSNKKITTGDSSTFPISDVKLQAQDISALRPDLTVNLTSAQFTNELLLYNIYERKILEEKVIYLLDAYSNDESAAEAATEITNVVEMLKMLKKSMLPIYEDSILKLNKIILEFLNEIDVSTEGFIGAVVVNENGKTEGIIKLPNKHKQGAPKENNE